MIQRTIRVSHGGKSIKSYLIASQIYVSGTTRATNPWGTKGCTKEVLVYACLALMLLLPTHLLLAGARLWSWNGPQRPSLYFCFCQGVGTSLCATGPGVDQAASLVQASRELWAGGLLKGVGASFSLPGEPRLGGLQMASWGSDCTPTGSAEFPKKKLKENRTLCKGKAAYICIVMS